MDLPKGRPDPTRGRKKEREIYVPTSLTGKGGKRERGEGKKRCISPPLFFAEKGGTIPSTSSLSS